MKKRVLSEEEVNEIVLNCLNNLKERIAIEAADDAAEASTYAVKANMSANHNGKRAAFASAAYASSAATSARDAAEKAVRDQNNDLESTAGAVIYALVHRSKAAEQLIMAKIHYEDVEAICVN